MLAAILIIIAASVSFSVVTLLILFYIGKCPDAEQTQDDDSRYYDENRQPHLLRPQADRPSRKGKRTGGAAK